MGLRSQTLRIYTSAGSDRPPHEIAFFDRMRCARRNRRHAAIREGFRPASTTDALGIWEAITGPPDRHYRWLHRRLTFSWTLRTAPESRGGCVLAAFSVSHRVHGGSKWAFANPVSADLPYGTRVAFVRNHPTGPTEQTILVGEREMLHAASRNSVGLRRGYHRGHGQLRWRSSSRITTRDSRCSSEIIRRSG